MNGPKLIYTDLNSRLYSRPALEHDVIGPHLFGDDSISFNADNNRQLLIEVCNALNLCIAKTFFEHPPDSTVTFWAIGGKPLAPVSVRSFAKLDFCVVQKDWLSAIEDVYSDRTIALSSHHFIVISNVHIDIPKTLLRQRSKRPDYSRCRDPDMALSFASEVHHWMQQLDSNAWIDMNDPNSINESLNGAFAHASEAILPLRKYIPKRPWISAIILDLIEKRDAARLYNDFAAE